MLGEGISIYLVGLGLIWIFYAVGYAKEPTAHGQSILVTMGCLLGIFWPLALAYMIIGSPYFVWMLWKTRGER